jgi:hypothetical protein
VARKHPQKPEQPIADSGKADAAPVESELKCSRTYPGLRYQFVFHADRVLRNAEIEQVTVPKGRKTGDRKSLR